MSHHYSGPDFGFPHGDPRLDLTDVYAFPSPVNAGKSILVMNVHPSDGFDPPERTTRDPFATEALYELKIDTDGDAVADVAYRVRFSASGEGAQTATLRRVEGTPAAGTADSGQIVVEGAPVSTGREARVTEAGGYRLFAGWRSDPFFFDTAGARNNLQFTGDDFFADKDVCSIVLEVPNPDLGLGKLGIWARTLDGAGGGWVQADRGGRPAQAVFLTGAEREAYLAAEPAGDGRFIAVFAHSLEHAAGYTAAEAAQVAGTLLPDILSYDPKRPASFPENGRALTDDAVDVFVRILTNGKVTGDKVGHHHDLLAEFPYLGPPHNGYVLGARETNMPQHVSYRAVKVDGLSIFYREAGPQDAPTILLLHGLPSSSRMFEPLFARLADSYHLVAPDYPGFGHSDWPAPKTFAYTFDHYAAIMNHFIEALGLSRYTLYMQDYGGPVGFRMALAHPDRIEALIVQDAVAHNEGLGASWGPRRAFWADRAANEATLRTNLLSLETTRRRHVGSDPDVERYDPDLWADEFAFLSQPGQADIQSDLFYDYRTNVDAYPTWQAWMGEHQPRLLVLWGKYDLSFELSEPEAYRRDVPKAEVHVLDAGHFALDTAADQIAQLVRDFMGGDGREVALEHQGRDPEMHSHLTPPRRQP